MDFDFRNILIDKLDRLDEDMVGMEKENPEFLELFVFRSMLYIILNHVENEIDINTLSLPLGQPFLIPRQQSLSIRQISLTHLPDLLMAQLMT